MDVKSFLLDENDWVPNNTALPVLVYRAVEAGDCEQVATAFEKRFARNGWPPQWRDTIYDYHHYHSTAHEALGVAAGTAVLELGGPGARSLEVGPGDVLILPVGTGHRRVSQTDDFLVVGAYPQGQEWDVCQDAPTKDARARMANLAAPERNPVTGEA